MEQKRLLWMDIAKAIGILVVLVVHAELDLGPVTFLGGMFYMPVFFVLAGMTLWAILGNSLYNGTSENYSHFFNWFFVVRDPFGLLPATLAPYVMPFVNIAVFFLVEILISGSINKVKQIYQNGGK